MLSCVFACMLCHLSSGGKGGKIQTNPEHEGLLACQIQYCHMCHSGGRRPVGPSPGGCHLHLPADAGADDSLRCSDNACIHGSPFLCIKDLNCLCSSCRGLMKGPNPCCLGPLHLKNRTQLIKQQTLNVSCLLSVSYHYAGLHIISNLDEVAFIQNLVFYIEAAYKVAVSNI